MRTRTRQYTVEFKIMVVEDYLNSTMSAREVAEKHGVVVYTKVSKKGYVYYASPSVSSWVRLYREGKLRLDNAVSVSHGLPIGVKNTSEVPYKIEEVKDTKVELSGTVVLVEYIKPIVYNIGGKEYILQEPLQA